VLSDRVIGSIFQIPRAPITLCPRRRAPRSLTVAGNELKVFVRMAALLEAMLGDISRARARVWVETYIFAATAGGRPFCGGLKERARGRGRAGPL